MKVLFNGLLALMVLQGCASTPAGDKSAQKAYMAIEDKLMSTPVLRVDYEIEAHGLISADIDGDLVMQKPDLAAISANGVFISGDVAPTLIADGKKMRGGNALPYFDHAVPEDLRTGLLIGLMRMGILHNLATLSQGLPPEGTDGDVREWVVAQDFQWQTLSRQSGDVELRGIGFSIYVDGEPAGDVVLWYDPISGLPVERVQVVHFPSGDMYVNERYTIETDGMIGPCRFDL